MCSPGPSSAINGVRTGTRPDFKALLLMKVNGKLGLRKSFQVMTATLEMQRPFKLFVTSGVTVPARLWPGLRQLWLPQTSGQAKAATHGLAQAAAFVCKNEFLCMVLHS